MESKKERHERLEKKLQEIEKQLELDKLALEKEKKVRMEAEKKLNNIENDNRHLSKRLFGVDFYEIENNLLKSAYKIIND